MKIKHSSLASTALGGSAAAAFASFGRFGSRIAFAPEGGAGDGGDAAAQAAAAAAAEAARVAAEAAAKPKEGDDKPSDAEAKLLKEVMGLKTRLDAFKGVDPAEFKRLKEAETAAEAARVEKERVDAEKRGEFDRVKASMVEQHGNALKALQDKLDAADADKAKLGRTIDELTIGSSFLNSKFVADDLVLTPGKARTVYGAHFTQEDGRTIAYDKPAGAGERTKLVDAKGEPLGFEEALKKIVEADPDKDRMLRSRMKGGAGSGTLKEKITDAGAGAVKGVSRIAAALAERNKKAA